MRTAGVDLAADPLNTGLCVVDWELGTIALAARPVTDEVIVDAVLDADLTGVDVPLGWPDGFVDALVAHREGGPWPTGPLPSPEDRVPLRLRRTDVAAIDAGARPLSVSSDRIGVAAMRGARIQDRLRRAGATVDRSGITGVVAETYPAGALRAWGMQSTRYKTAANAEVRAALVAVLVDRCGALASASAACLGGCGDHDLDAFICALLARAALLGHTTAPAADDIPVARREGWIHLPTATVETITAGV